MSIPHLKQYEDRLKPYRFKPGQSGNPKGRPKHRQLSERYKEVMEFPLPLSMCKQLGLPKNATLGDGIAMALGLSAIKGAPNGMVDAAREIADRTEGKALQRNAFEGPTAPPPNITIEFVDPPPQPPQILPPVVAQNVPSIAPAPAELSPAPESTAVVVPQHCIGCGKPIHLHTVGKRKRWVHTHDGEPYCAPASSSDMRTATPAPERNTP